MIPRIYVILDAAGAVAEYAWGETPEAALAVARVPSGRAIDPGWGRHPPFPWHEAAVSPAGEVFRSLTRRDMHAERVRAGAARDAEAERRAAFAALRAEAADYSAAALQVPEDLQARLDAAREAFRAAVGGRG